MTTPSTSTQHDLSSGADWIACEPAEVQKSFLDELGEDEILALPFLFDFWAMPHQLPPAGDWRSWVIMGGRGAGKTRAGAEWVRACVEGSRPLDPGRCHRIALVGETLDQVREVMVFGESGILACSPPDRRPEWHATRRMLIWPNGATAQAFSAHEPESLRGPQFDGAWVDELGCPAVDKGTNQPNVFLDPKSSESFLPAHSNGQRDEVIQMQYLRAMLGYWRAAENNPVSSVYGGPMLDMARAFVWAWDARPYPFFPANAGLWGDAPNYARGHWVTGRLSSRSLASVVREICARAGITAQDTGTLHGLVRGYAISQVTDARAALQPLMLAHGFDAVERDGVLRFVMRRDGVAHPVPVSALVDLPESPPRPQHSRAAEAAMTGRVRLRFVQSDTDYPAISEEAVMPDEATHAVAASELPLLLTRAEGRQITERWLAEARIARDGVRLALPPSLLHLGAGDLLRLEGDATGAAYRIDRVELGAAQLIEAVRADPGVYLPAALEDEGASIRPTLAPLPVFPLFLDLPLMTGDEVPHAPHIAVTAEPWPGAAAVYASVTGQGFALNRTVAQAAVIGVTQDALPAARPGLLHARDAFTVRLTSGALSSIDLPTLLAGGNLAALGDGTPDRWELFQFASATLVAPDTWRLETLLRGQLGSDALIPSVWPEGSLFVLMDGCPEQIDLPLGARGLLRHYRIGPAWRPLDDPSYIALQDSFAGIGLKPLAPVHLRAAAQADGALRITWVRRGRIDADAWEAPDIPLGEETESYQLRVMQGVGILRELTLSTTVWTYAATDRIADLQGGTVRIEVAQISARFGPGFRAVLNLGA